MKRCDSSQNASAWNGNIPKTIEILIIHVMQHRNDPEWLRTVVLPVAQQKNTKNHHETMKNIKKM